MPQDRHPVGASRFIGTPLLYFIEYYEYITEKGDYYEKNIIIIINLSSNLHCPGIRLPIRTGSFPGGDRRLTAVLPMGEGDE